MEGNLSGGDERSKALLGRFRESHIVTEHERQPCKMWENSHQGVAHRCKNQRTMGNCSSRDDSIPAEPAAAGPQDIETRTRQSERTQEGASCNSDEELSEHEDEQHADAEPIATPLNVRDTILRTWDIETRTHLRSERTHEYADIDEDADAELEEVQHVAYLAEALRDVDRPLYDDLSDDILRIIGDFADRLYDALGDDDSSTDSGDFADQQPPYKPSARTFLAPQYKLRWRKGLQVMDYNMVFESMGGAAADDTEEFLREMIEEAGTFFDQELTRLAEAIAIGDARCGSLISKPVSFFRSRERQYVMLLRWLQQDNSQDNTRVFVVERYRRTPS